MCSVLRIGVSVKQQFTEEEIYKDRDSQIAAIEKTFEDAQKPVRVPRVWLCTIHCAIFSPNSSYSNNIKVNVQLHRDHTVHCMLLLI